MEYDSKIGRLFIGKESGTWKIAVEGSDFIITDQCPVHSVLRRGHDIGRKAKVRIISETYAELLRVYRRQT